MLHSAIAFFQEMATVSPGAFVTLAGIVLLCFSALVFLAFMAAADCARDTRRATRSWDKAKRDAYRRQGEAYRRAYRAR